MRFKKYLIEDKDKERARKKIAKRIKVDPTKLIFIGQDEYGYYFNVMDRKHPEYKSTKFERS